MNRCHVFFITIRAFPATRETRGEIDELTCDMTDATQEVHIGEDVSE